MAISVTMRIQDFFKNILPLRDSGRSTNCADKKLSLTTELSTLVVIRLGIGIQECFNGMFAFVGLRVLLFVGYDNYCDKSQETVDFRSAVSSKSWLGGSFRCCGSN